MADVSVEELEKEIAKILKNADLAKTSTNKVIQKLEEVFGVELAEKKKMIDQMVIEYVNAQESEEENEDDDDEEEEEEEKPKKSSKRAAPVSKRSTKKRKDSSEDEDDDDDNSDSEYEKEKPKKKKGKKKDSDDDFEGGWGKKDKKKAPKAKKAGGGRGKGGGYTRAYKLSPALSALMGADEMPRHEVVKRVWAIIKEKKLYDPNNRQFAICDDALYKVIGTKRFRTFGMMKYLKSHFIDE
ncbi:upstream activation factor subunit spp27 homolog Non2 [Aphomia sociella]